jgi:SAM-dependent methyltransferase
MARFGELRLVRDDVGPAPRLLYRLMGVADPAHYLHHRYVVRGLVAAGSQVPTAILDAGCGRGDHSVWLARRFPQAEVLGIDIDAPRISANRAAAARLPLTNLRFEVGDLTRLELERAVDLVVSVDVLEHIVEQGLALRRLRAALRPGGFAVLHVPTRRERPVPFSKRLQAFHAWAEDEHVAEEATSVEFVARVRDAGFEVQTSFRTFGYWTGELATSLFALFYKDTPANRVFQACLAPICRGLVLLDPVIPQAVRYALVVIATRPSAT